jgi:lipopolysaccharide/colanic/teichoic acid biosynthesis glycosyltransferase
MINLDDTGSFYRWAREVPAHPAGPVERGIKRAVDIALASALLVAAAPMLVAAMAAVRLTSRGPALFASPRIGYRCQRFAMLKLRTMVADAERAERRMAEERADRTFFKVEDDPRVTPVGRFLRRWSLDELPQLWNVIRGDMSLVGPRPLLLTDFAKYPKQAQMRRFSVRPGMTGLWQVSGRSRLADAERVRLDLEYVDSLNLRLDLAILLRTPTAVMGGDGAY